MREEIAAAVVFLTRVVKEDNDSAHIKEHMEKFSDSLTTLLRERFKNHWYEDKPHKGQGYRCIRMNRVSPDPVLLQAAEQSGLQFHDLQLPKELTLWVDPAEVTCRIGEQNGSAYCTVATFRNGQNLNQAHTINITQVLEQHYHKRNQALSYFHLASSSRVNAASPQVEDAGVSTSGDPAAQGGKYSPFSPAKYHYPHPRHHYHPNTHWAGAPPALPPPKGGVRAFHKYSYHHRSSPPFDMHRHRGSPPFLPPSSSPPGYHGDKRHWMRGPDLVKA